MFEQKLRFQYSGRFGSQIEPNPKINRAKDAHGYCASFSLLIKKSTFRHKRFSAKQIHKKTKKGPGKAGSAVEEKEIKE